MDWNREEIADVTPCVAALSASTVPRHAALDRPLILDVADTAALQDGIPPPGNPCAVAVRHLLRAIGSDETRLTPWRLEHKLVQALVLEHCCPGVVPPTRGLARELGDLPRVEQRRRIEALEGDGLLLKASVGESSSDRKRRLAIDALLRELDDDAAALERPRSLSDERFVIQERIAIEREYRVHSLEDRAIPDLAFCRHAPFDTPDAERRAVSDFVQSILDRLPDALVSGLLYGWDIARDRSEQWYVIETNPSGYHPVFRPGFHCSGFLQDGEWGPTAIAWLLRFVQERYGVHVRVMIDADTHAGQASTYQAIARCLDRLSHDDATARGPYL
jgi:hypothetical protein